MRLGRNARRACAETATTKDDAASRAVMLGHGLDSLSMNVRGQQSDHNNAGVPAVHGSPTSIYSRGLSSLSLVAHNSLGRNLNYSPSSTHVNVHGGLFHPHTSSNRTRPAMEPDAFSADNVIPTRIP